MALRRIACLALAGTAAVAEPEACADGSCQGDDAAALLQLRQRFPFGPWGFHKWVDGVERCLNATAESLTRSLPNVSRWDSDDDEGFSGIYVNDGDSDMYDDGNALSVSVVGLGFSPAVNYTQQCDGTWSKLGHGDVEYFTCRVDTTDTLNLQDGNESTVWFAGFRSASGSISGLKIGGELGADGKDGSLGLAGRTPTPRGGYYGYYTQTVGTGDPSINQLLLVPDSKWVHAYTPGEELQAEGGIFTEPGTKPGRRCMLKKGAPVHALFYMVWGGNTQGIPFPNNTVYTPQDFQTAFDSVATTC